MYEYQTQFSKTCRMIASKTRLQLLWILFDGEYCVEDLAVSSGISPQHASKLLSALAADHLITHQRQNRKVFYHPGLSGPQKKLLKALADEKESKSSFETIIHHATAFTHERRIQIVRCISSNPKTFETLLKKTGMTTSALTRHLRKLIKRDVLEKQNQTYCLRKPSSPLVRYLMMMAIR